MPTITLSATTDVNLNQTLTVDELKQNFLFGLPLEKDGKVIPNSLYEFHLKAAQDVIEGLLNVKLQRQIIEERKDFIYDDWVHWSYVKGSYPVVYPVELHGFLGTTRQVSYPQSWLQAKKTNDGKLYSRHLFMVPTYNSAATHNNAIIFSGVMPNLNWYASYGANGHIPIYWNMKYVTGFHVIPHDILSAMGMLASLSILPILSDFLMGNTQVGITGSGIGWGINSKSISIDGLSQSLSSGASNGIFNARLKQYQERLGDIEGNKKGELKRLMDYYGQLIWITA